ncbi:hypothetical protein V0288_00690 [Pannus brasiliensis CCIBt3594]|uniref:Type 4 pilin n=1 Tax=Pannus brasiliensis CCIBt3594 TaxID=1427578 RepID=A0AAW9QQS3_9CHRO
MLEVVIAILTITTFLTGTLQLMAINALYKARSERQIRANYWIQEDMEDVKLTASRLNDPGACTTGYAQALKSALAAQVIASRTFVGKRYELIRKFPDDKKGLHRLRIDYTVQLASTETANDYQNQETVIATSSFEVIPDASFQCP